MDKKLQLIGAIEKYHSTIRALCPNKSLPSSESLTQTPSKISKPTAIAPPARPMSVPTAAALKMGVGFPLTNLPGVSEDTNRILSTQCLQQGMKTPPPPELMFECGICKKANDQHCLVQCDTCQLHFHLGCLSPPLTRHPKKSKIYGWQCSECDEDNPESTVPIATGPRKSRTKYNKDGTIVPVDATLVNGSATKEPKTDTRSTCLSPSSVKSEPKSNPRIKSPFQSDASISDVNKTPKSEKKIKRKNDEKKRVKKKLLEKSPEQKKSPEENKSPEEKKSPDEKTSPDQKKSMDQEKSPEQKKISEQEKTLEEVKGPEQEKSPEKKKKPKKKSSPVKLNQTNESINKDSTLSTDNNDSINTSQESESSPSKKRKSKTKVVKKIADPSQIDSIIDLVIKNSIIEDNAVEDCKPEIIKPENISSESLPDAKPVEKIEPLNNSMDILPKQEDTTPDEKTNHKQSRKRRKEKHRSKDRSERSSSKEHKKKRKRKNHDEEKPISCSLNTDGVPKIKIKVF